MRNQFDLITIRQGDDRVPYGSRCREIEPIPGQHAHVIYLEFESGKRWFMYRHEVLVGVRVDQIGETDESSR